MNNVYIKLFNMNSNIIEYSKNINLEIELKDEFEKLLENKHFFKRYGLIPNKIELSILDINKFILFILNLLWKDYNVIDCQNIGILGHPDFKLIHKEDSNDIIYLELKIESDSLRSTQLEWFFNNKDKICKVIWISNDLSNLNRMEYM